MTQAWGVFFSLSFHVSTGHILSISLLTWKEYTAHPVTLLTPLRWFLLLRRGGLPSHVRVAVRSGRICRRRVSFHLRKVTIYYNCKHVRKTQPFSQITWCWVCTKNVPRTDFRLLSTELHQKHKAALTAWRSSKKSDFSSIVPLIWESNITQRKRNYTCVTQSLLGTATCK